MHGYELNFVDGVPDLNNTISTVTQADLFFTVSWHVNQLTDLMPGQSSTLS